MVQQETNVWKNAQLYASSLGHRLFRNQRYKGPIVRKGKVTKAWADCGVAGDGGSDLIGWRSIVITEDMVGKKIAQFVAAEAKTKDNIRGGTPDQDAFIKTVKDFGGIAGYIYDNDDLKKLMDEWDAE